MEPLLTVEDLIAARDAIESWVDVFREVDGDDKELQDKCDRAEVVARRLAVVILEMQGPQKPRLRLVPPSSEGRTE